MTVKACCPAGVDALVVTVRSVLPLVDRLAGLKLAWAPGSDETPSVLRLTVPVMPPNAIVLKLNTARRVESTVTPEGFWLSSQ
jgi:hypothetical protein